MNGNGLARFLAARSRWLNSERRFTCAVDEAMAASGAPARRLKILRRRVRRRMRACQLRMARMLDLCGAP